MIDGRVELQTSGDQHREQATIRKSEQQEVSCEHRIALALGMKIKQEDASPQARAVAKAPKCPSQNVNGGYSST